MTEKIVQENKAQTADSVVDDGSRPKESTNTGNQAKTVPDNYQDAKEQLNQIVAQVRKSDVSLERSLDLLEEGVALANRCTELIDQAAWSDTESSEDVDTSDQPANDDTADIVG